jgi:hypothetical protein
MTSRTFGAFPSRRELLRGLAAAGFGYIAARSPEVRGARKRPRRNEYGCLDVGEPCAGRDSRCCSGVCRGKRPRKGKPDASRCVAHDATTCRAGDHEPFCGGSELVLCTTSTGFAGQCNTTTGNAGYCLASSICYPCAKDADCRTVCGAKAACLTCTDCMETGGTMCGNPDFPGCSAM